MKIFHRIMRAVLVCAAVSVALAGTNAWADLTDKQANLPLAFKAERGDKAALATLMSEAEQGNAAAQESLGWLYFNSRSGVLKDHGQAEQWWRKAAQGYLKAAEQGDANAQANLGSLYAGGRGVLQDDVEAVRWFRQAAWQGDADGQLKLGLSYSLGSGVPKDDAQAAQWLRLAAKQGKVAAQESLGYAYELGHGVPQSKIVAYALCDLSIKLDPLNGGPAFNLNKLDRRSRLGQSMTSQEIKDAEALSQEMNRPGNLLQALDQYLASLLPARQGGPGASGLVGQ